MKKAKRFMTFVLAMIMVLAMGMSAMAATITIQEGIDGQTYTAYKIFDVTTSGTGEDASYAYTIKVNDQWYPTVADYAYEAESESADTDKGLYLTAIAGTSDPVIYNVSFDDTKFNAVDFAKTLNGVDKSAFTESGKIESYSNTVNSIDNLAQGYYFVDSSVGSLCMLKTATDTVNINEKNSVPTIEKKVKEDSTSEWSDAATADIDQEVEYKLTINVGDGFTEKNANLGTGNDKAYVITDTLPAGLTVKTVENSSNVDSTAMTSAVMYDGTSDTDGTPLVLVTDLNGDTINKLTSYTATIEDNVMIITLPATLLEGLDANSTIVLTYKATLNTSANVATDDSTLTDDDNINTVYLTYGSYKTVEDTANVKTFDIDVFKFTGEDKTPLADAKFTLTRKSDNTVISYITAEGSNVYTVVKAGTEGALTEITTPNTGTFTIQGLDADTYLLKETKAPAGYNQLKDAIEVVVDENGAVTYKLLGTDEASEATSEDSTYGILVENQSGAVLPSTGGIGTTMFYVVGGALVLVAVVLLVTRRRMDAQER